MSRGQLQRTPENFPRMKYRARGRHLRAAARRRQQPALALVDAFAEVGRRIARAFESFIAAFRSPPNREDFVLMPPRKPSFPPMSIQVGPAELRHQYELRARSVELARQRGHLRQ